MGILPSALIMLVEDDVAFRAVLQDILELEGYRTLVASDGKHALEVLHESPSSPDLMISDVHFGFIDGVELAQMLSTHEQWKTMNIIFLSGGTDPRLEDKHLSLPNVKALLPKPFIRNELLQAIDQVLKHG